MTLGVGKITGRLRNDIAPNLYDLTCTVCRAGWVGEEGEWCAYCAARIDETIAEQAKLDRLNGKPADTNGDNGDGDLLGQLLNWPEFWAQERQDAQWLAEPLIPAQRSVALFAPADTTKSLLVLWIVAALATGRPVFGRIREAIHVLYLDYEMTEDDLMERLENMGYTPDDDLSHLHYALLPDLPALDDPEGGKAVVRLAQLCDAELVVVDTFGRAVHGDENDSDTVRSWYRWTGMHLKAEGRAFIRIDHAGKDVTKGQRGTSAKNDDVDVVWQMSRQDDDTFRLATRKRRMSWVPQEVDVRLHQSTQDGPLHYTQMSGHSYPAGTAELVKLLDKYGVPVDHGYRKAAEILRAAGQPRGAGPIRAALKFRREAVDNLTFSESDSPPPPQTRTHPQTHPPTNGSQAGTDSPSDSPGLTNLSRGVSLCVVDTDSPLDPQPEPVDNFKGPF